MIDCRTQHGTWRHKPTEKVVKFIEKYGLEMGNVDIKDYARNLKLLYINIAFFDKFGKYTGFRLKSLK
jgi:hypothetical protein